MEQVVFSLTAWPFRAEGMSDLDTEAQAACVCICTYTHQKERAQHAVLSTCTPSFVATSPRSSNPRQVHAMTFRINVASTNENGKPINESQKRGPIDDIVSI